MISRLFRAAFLISLSRLRFLFEMWAVGFSFEGSAETLPAEPDDDPKLPLKLGALNVSAFCYGVQAGRMRGVTN